jgi:hypothetical protein
MLADAGVPLGCQTVLLKGVNDDPAVMKRLMQALLKARVRPYYIYQADVVAGGEHFRTSIQKGLEIIQALRGWTSGMAVPHFVIDAPGGGGKIPLLPEYVQAITEDEVILRNYAGKEYRYPLPKEEGSAEVAGAPAHLSGSAPGKRLSGNGAKKRLRENVVGADACSDGNGGSGKRNGGNGGNGGNGQVASGNRRSGNGKRGNGKGGNSQGGNGAGKRGNGTKTRGQPPRELPVLAAPTAVNRMAAACGVLEGDDDIMYLGPIVSIPSEG